MVEIIYEDKYLVALNKPSGLIVNNSRTTKEETLQNWVMKNFPKCFSSGGESDFYTRNGLVHRLDKDTSGVILMAKNEEVFLALQALFKNREVKKEYRALVFGEIEEDLIEINAPIARNPNIGARMAVVENGKEAVTKIERISVLGSENTKLTLIKAFPKTGRTHQIRVHLAAFNHPIVGDNIYSGAKRSVASFKEYGRLMLHAHKLSFKHPVTGENLELVSEIPPELLEVE